MKTLKMVALAGILAGSILAAPGIGHAQDNGSGDIILVASADDREGRGENTGDTRSRVGDVIGSVTLMGVTTEATRSGGDIIDFDIITDVQDDSADAETRDDNTGNKGSGDILEFDLIN